MKRKSQSTADGLPGILADEAVYSTISSNNAPIGTGGDDDLVATADQQEIVGLGGHDRLSGGGFIDVSLSGGDGRDILDMGGGDMVRADGGAGGDYMFGYSVDGFFAGGSGDDMMLVSDYCGADGGAGNDFLYCQSDGYGAHGGKGNDILYGGVDDLIYGDAGNDILVARGQEADGGAGRDLVFAATTGVSRGGSGNDIMLVIEQSRAAGDGGNDLLVSLAGGTLEGGAGRDVLLGNLSSGGVVMDGGRDADLLFGSRFADLLTGGAGADTFYFAPGGQSDRITDFAVNADRLDVSAYDFTDRSEVLATARSDGDGVTLDLGDGDQVTLEGVSIDAIAAAVIVTSGGEDAVTAAIRRAQQGLDAGQARLDAAQDDIQMLFEMARGTSSGPTALPVTDLDPATAFEAFADPASLQMSAADADAFG